MKRFIETIKNIWSIDELRTKIIYTVMLLFVYRLGAHIVLPGISNHLDLAANTASTGLIGLLNSFAGGAFSRASIFALGVMPYISASIAVQLLGFALPAFQKMQKEESGRNKLNQYTRYLTVVVTVLQSIGYVTYIHQSLNVQLSISPTLFAISSVFILTTGTLFVMWLGERITENGIGNGVSILIMVGIMSRFPTSLISEWKLRASSGGFLIYLLEIAFLVAVIMAIIVLVQGVRRVPVDYARQIAGGRKKSTTQVGASRQYIPLKVNMVGVMPIIFAQALLFLPGMIAGAFDPNSTWVQSLSDYTSFTYNLMYFVMVLLFTYFYTALTFNPTSMADDLKRSNAFIPGVKPGQDTANYIGTIMDRITLPGAVFLGIIGILPGIVAGFGINSELSTFFGGTSMLIMVGVIIDTLQQIESYLLMKKYDGLMDGVEMQSRSSSPVSMSQF